jgi:hypothetical protein
LAEVCQSLVKKGGGRREERKKEGGERKRVDTKDKRAVEGSGKIESE